MTQTFINIYDLSRKKVAVLQNAYGITEKKEINQIYGLEFNLPEPDEKGRHCQPFYYVRYGEDTQMYRIAKQNSKTSNTGTISYTCEHAIVTLCDTLLFGSYAETGKRTRAMIDWLLDKQPVKNWILDECDFDFAYEYCWEQENLLNALYSIPKPFADPYIWTFDCSTYPWKLSLKRIDVNATPGYYIRAKRNLLGTGISSDHAEICTRLFPLGYGEGVNQLTIKSVNNGVPYLQAPASVIDQYGIVERVLVDRSFESAESLKAYGQTVLDKLSSPRYEQSFDVADLYPMTGSDIDSAEVGKICRLTGDGTTVFITSTERVLDNPGYLKISLSNKSSSVVDTIADLADRIRIETVYAQGATQIYQHAKDANATPTKGMVLSLYFPSEMRQINKVLLRLKLEKFRSYSQATNSKTVEVESCENKTVTVKSNSEELGGQKTTLDGGGTTSSSGGTSVTVGGGRVSNQSTGDKGVSVDVSASGISYAPQYTETSEPSTDISSGEVWENETSNVYTNSLSDNMLWTHEPDSDSPTGHIHGVNTYGFQLSIPRKNLSHTHNINHYHTVSVLGTASGGSHSHSFSIPSHTHTISAHSHTLPSLSHSHTITLNGHTHTITLKGHSHEITAGIFESGNPTAFDIYVNGEKKQTISAKSYNGDITQWLLGNNNQVPRNTWITVEIRPNDLSYVVASVFVQGFVQSRGGGNY